MGKEINVGCHPVFAHLFFAGELIPDPLNSQGPLTGIDDPRNLFRAWNLLRALPSSLSLERL